MEEALGRLRLKEEEQTQKRTENAGGESGDKGIPASGVGATG
jgi:hypothetical protein